MFIYPCQLITLHLPGHNTSGSWFLIDCYRIFTFGPIKVPAHREPWTLEPHNLLYVWPSTPEPHSTMPLLSYVCIWNASQTQHLKETYTRRNMEASIAGLLLKFYLIWSLWLYCCLCHRPGTCIQKTKSELLMSFKWKWLWINMAPKQLPLSEEAHSGGLFFFYSAGFVYQTTHFIK